MRSSLARARFAGASVRSSPPSPRSAKATMPACVCALFPRPVRLRLERDRELPRLSSPRLLAFLHRLHRRSLAQGTPGASAERRTDCRSPPPRSPRFQPLKPGRPILGFNPQVVLRALPVVSLWGFAGVGALAVVGSAIPRFQRECVAGVTLVRVGTFELMLRCAPSATASSTSFRLCVLSLRCTCAICTRKSALTTD